MKLKEKQNMKESAKESEIKIRKIIYKFKSYNCSPLLKSPEHGMYG